MCVCARARACVCVSQRQVLPELLLALACPHAPLRFIVKWDDRGRTAFMNRLWTTVDHHSADDTWPQIMELPMNGDDNFSGGAHVYALCRLANHSFVHHMQLLRRHGPAAEQRPTAKHDLLQAFEANYKYEQSSLAARVELSLIHI